MKKPEMNSRQSYETEYALNNLKVYNNSQATRTYMKNELFRAEKIIFEKYVKKGMHILDLGCGTGRTTTHLSIFDNRIVGIDYSEAMIKVAHERSPLLDFRVADAKTLPLQDAIFDVALFSFNGLDNLFPKSDRLRAVTEVRRVLKPGGLFVYSSHNRFRLPIGRARLGNFFKNIFRGTLFSDYTWDFQKYGQLLLYRGSIWSEKNDLKKIGFNLLGHFGNKHESVVAVALLESYTYYVFRKG